ncbi:3-hydroxyacyl-ACP dehydratase FabZ family protein [Zobellella sp. DQSA1]|uniref:3-hydroxyacyl-ACP dehydratase FabZ family protein n=1 Tax=Zobellella sp. DQSA1 TaxID=3342386 RepID=UPI0035C1207B
MSYPALQELLPHRGDMLLLDAIEHHEPGQGLTTVKSVTPNEFWVPGHFPGNPVMPGVLLTEALAQSCAAFMALENRRAETGDDQQTEPQVYLLLRSDVRFIKPVKPTALLHCDVKQVDASAAFTEFRVEARVDQERCVRGKLYVACRPLPQEVPV